MSNQSVSCSSLMLGTVSGHPPLDSALRRIVHETLARLVKRGADLEHQCLESTEPPRRLRLPIYLQANHRFIPIGDDDLLTQCSPVLYGIRSYFERRPPGYLVAARGEVRPHLAGCATVLECGE